MISFLFRPSSEGSREGEASQRCLKHQQPYNPACPHVATARCLQPVEELQPVSPDQAGPGNSVACAERAIGGGLPANPIPRVLGDAKRSESSSRTAQLPGASARGCLCHRDVSWKPHRVPPLHIIPAGCSRGNSRDTKMHIARKRTSRATAQL